MKGDGVDALGFQLHRLLHESGEVLLRASRGEVAGNSEEDGLLPLGEVRDGDGLDVAGGVEVGEGGLRKLVADSDGGGFRNGESKRLGGMAVLEAKESLEESAAVFGGRRVVER
ncbi:hypothetical protein TIFTF001_004999 [Ficus carica]|uniref:Uncharacterized protein n=1 Tax=Ficus carica TaxID=3494 RepID=A0AA88A028_FICCA|nr:hypothetical protein TIFTF001_004999 [Ficus carica]